MANRDSETTNVEDDLPSTTETDAGTRPTRRDVRATFVSAAKNGTGALLAGSVLLARFLRTVRTNRWRAAMNGLVGAALLAIGIRQRRSEGAGGQRYRRSAEVEPGSIADEEARARPDQSDPGSQTQFGFDDDVTADRETDPTDADGVGDRDGDESTDASTKFGHPDRDEADATDMEGDAGPDDGDA